MHVWAPMSGLRFWARAAIFLIGKGKTQSPHTHYDMARVNIHVGIRDRRVDVKHLNIFTESGRWASRDAITVKSWVFWIKFRVRTRARIQVGVLRYLLAKIDE